MTETKRLTKGQATEVTEKVTTKRRPRTLTEQIADLQAKGASQLEKLNTRYARELAAVAVTMRKIDAQRVALGQAPHFSDGELKFELTESGAWVTQVPGADASSSEPADTSTPGESEVKGDGSDDSSKSGDV
jgi:hypothetical protein